MALHTAHCAQKGALARPDTTRTNNTDAGRPWVLLDVPGHKQEEAGIIRRVKTPAHTKKATTKKARERAHHTKGGSESCACWDLPPCSPVGPNPGEPSPVQAGPPVGTVLGGAVERKGADSAAS